MLYPFLNPRKRGERNLFENFASCSNNTFSKIEDIVGSTLTGLKFSLFSGSSFLNIDVMSAAFSSLGNSFFLIDSFIQLAKSLQISLFASLTISLGKTPIVFFVESDEVIILEISSLLTKLKSNSLIHVKTDLILRMLRSISHFLIALTSGSLQGRFEHCHLSMFNPLVMSLKYVLKRNFISSLLETTFSFSTSIILSSKFVS